MTVALSKTKLELAKLSTKKKGKYKLTNS